MSGIEIQGHRGVSSALENTIQAFDQAIKEGADSVEFDIQWSNDGKLFLIHDNQIIIGDKSVLVSELSYAAIKASALDPNLYPLLEEVLVYYADQESSLILDIELKDQGLPLERVEELMLLIKRFEKKLSLRLRSFEQRFIPTFLTAAHIQVGLVTDHDNEEWLEEARTLGVHYVCPHSSRVDKTLVDHAHQFGMRVIPWTVNSEEQLKYVMDCGVDGITTDHPGKLKEYYAKL